MDPREVRRLYYSRVFQNQNLKNNYLIFQKQNRAAYKENQAKKKEESDRKEDKKDAAKEIQKKEADTRHDWEKKRK